MLPDIISPLRSLGRVLPSFPPFCQRLFGSVCPPRRYFCPSWDCLRSLDHDGCTGLIHTANSNCSGSTGPQWYYSTVVVPCIGLCCQQRSWGCNGEITVGLIRGRARFAHQTAARHSQHMQMCPAAHENWR